MKPCGRGAGGNLLRCALCNGCWQILLICDVSAVRKKIGPIFLAFFNANLKAVCCKLFTVTVIKRARDNRVYLIKIFSQRINKLALIGLNIFCQNGIRTESGLNSCNDFIGVHSINIDFIIKEGFFKRLLHNSAHKRNCGNLIIKPKPYGGTL